MVVPEGFFFFSLTKTSLFDKCDHGVLCQGLVKHPMTWPSQGGGMRHDSVELGHIRHVV